MSYTQHTCCNLPNLPMSLDYLLSFSGDDGGCSFADLKQESWTYLQLSKMISTDFSIRYVLFLLCKEYLLSAKKLLTCLVKAKSLWTAMQHWTWRSRGQSPSLRERSPSPAAPVPVARRWILSPDVPLPAGTGSLAEVGCVGLYKMKHFFKSNQEKTIVNWRARFSRDRRASV